MKMERGLGKYLDYVEYLFSFCLKENKNPPPGAGIASSRIPASKEIIILNKYQQPS